MSEALAVREPANLEEFAAQHGVSLQVAADMLNAAQKDMQDITRARARMAFHGKGVNRLIEIADDKDDKRCMSAIEMLGRLAGEFKPPKPVVVNFQALMDGATNQSAGPLGGITQIREAEAIDGDDDT